VREQEIVTIKNVSLSKATFVKFKAKSVDFLEVTNPRAVLEVQLRKYTCLTVGDIIRIPHNRKFFDLEVKEVQPNGAASIIETDCNVDFDEPEGYQDSKYARYEKKAEAPAEPPKPRELQKAKLENEETEDSSSSNKFVPFSGAPKRIDGKIPPSVQQAKMSAPPVESKAESKSEKAETKDAAPVVPTNESRIGDKYSKKKVAVSAFGGTARKLDG
jgi:ubiquitin fusion degradation protein 1